MTLTSQNSLQTLKPTTYLILSHNLSPSIPREEGEEATAPGDDKAANLRMRLRLVKPLLRAWWEAGRA